MSAYRKSFTSREERRDALEAYVLGLSQFPVKYLAAAVFSFLRGSVNRWNPGDAPTPEEIAIQANRIWDRVAAQQRREQEDAERLAHQPPEPLSLEEQASRRAFVERAIKRMPPITKPDGRVPLTDFPQAQAQADLDALVANKNRAIPVSNEFFEKLTGKR